LDEEFNRHVTYYDGEDPRAIAAAIEEVITHYDEKVGLALELQEYVLKAYSISGTGEKLDVFLKSIVTDES
jgi:hypothetical protein